MPAPAVQLTTRPQARAAGRGDGPSPYARFGAIQWRGRFYWFRAHERPWMRVLFALAVTGSSVEAAELPRSLREDNDAYGTLIVEEGGRARLVEAPVWGPAS